MRTDHPAHARTAILPERWVQSWRLAPQPAWGAASAGATMAAAPFPVTWGGVLARARSLHRPALAVGFLLLVAAFATPVERADGSAVATRAHGVWWPARVDSSRGAREVELALRQPRGVERSAVGMAHAAELEGLVDRGEGGEPRARSFAAAALLARAARSGSTSDLLDAAELLASARGDLAAACNRVELWEWLGLSYRAREQAALCPPLAGATVAFAAARWNGKRVSAGDLPAGERAAVEALLAAGDERRAGGRIRSHAQAWRTYLEREALLEWTQAAADPAARRICERRLALLAAAYGAAAGNPAPPRLVAELAAVPPAAVAGATAAIGDWVAGSRRLSDIAPEDAVRRLRAARTARGKLLPSLEPLIAAALAGTRFHLGDTPGLGAQAQALRETLTAAQQPALVARCLWFEALALQGAAEWEASAVRARRAAALYDALGEPANAGLLGILEALDLESLNLEQRAEEAYLSALRNLLAANDTRQLATGLEIFGRGQGRAGRPHLAVEIQRELLAHRLAEGSLDLVVEAKIILAEQLQQAGETDRARLLLERVEPALRQVPSRARQARLASLWNQARAAVEVEADPSQAVARYTAFLAANESFGERYDIAESRLRRAQARLRLGDVEEATDDLVAGARETIAQCQRTREAASAAALLNQVRATLDLLVELLVATDDGGERALAWIEALKLEQQYRGLGREAPPVGWPELPPGACASEYFALEGRLLAWTRCAGGAPHLVVTEVGSAALAGEAKRLERALNRRDRAAAAASLRRLSAWLVAPIRGDLDGATSWSVVPDAVLAAVPFAWLEYGGRSLFERLDVTVATTFTDLRDEPRELPARWTPLAVGNPPVGDDPALYAAPLPGAEREARAVAARFGGRALTGAAATFSAVTGELPAFNLFHFAGHVYANQSLPALSRIQFAPSPATPSGRVAAQEIAAADLSTLHLVVLAGCSSARDSGRALGGTAELSQAFLLGGADAVVGTLWDVEDGALDDAFEVFYAALAAGSSPAQALRATWRAALQPEGEVDLFTAVALQSVTNHVGNRRRASSWR
jgi:CHAT domain-containing protein